MISCEALAICLFILGFMLGITFTLLIIKNKPSKSVKKFNKKQKEQLNRIPDAIFQIFQAIKKHKKNEM